jgi:hypothetical protein
MGVGAVISERTQVRGPERCRLAAGNISISGFGPALGWTNSFGEYRGRARKNQVRTSVMSSAAESPASVNLFTCQPRQASVGPHEQNQ